MNLKSRASLYFIIAAIIPLIASVVVLYFYLIGGLQRIENQNIVTAMDRVKAHFVSEGELLSQRISRALRAEDYSLLQTLLTKNRSGQIDQSKLIELTGQYQVLLKLDFLQIISPQGMVLASGTNPTDFNFQTDFDFFGKIISDGEVLGFSSYREDDKRYFSYINGQTLEYNDSIVAVIVGGIYIDNFYLQNLRLGYNTQTAALTGRLLLATSLSGEYLTALESELEKRSAADIASRIEINHTDYKPYFQKLNSLDEDLNYHFMLLYPPSYARQLTSQSLRIFGVVALTGIILAGLLGYAFAQRLSAPITELSQAAEKISEGKFDQKIIWFSNDEMGNLVDGFNHMYDRLRKSQQKLIQTEKLAAWNQMARKIAHEIKNPLTPIKISIEDLKRSYLRDEPNYKQILDQASETIITEIDKLKRIVDEFSSFAKLPTPDLKKVRVDRLISDSLGIYQNLIVAGQIMLDLDSNCGYVMADQGLFSQAVINIVKNALEAAPEGRIKISAMKINDQVNIVIRDQGPGIPEETLPQIFTPYFTTKQEGSGLGLVITQRIVFDHEGEISVNSDQTGTEFIIKLTAVD